MKTKPIPQNHMLADLPTALLNGMKALRSMKIRAALPIVALCSMLATTSAFGQTTYIWTNAAGGDIVVAANWNPNGVPSPTSGPDGNGLYGDELVWDGQTLTDLICTTDTGLTAFSGSNWGLRIHLTSNQAKAVTLKSLVAKSSGTRFGRITIDPGAGTFSMGDNTANVLDTLWGGQGGVTHPFLNNSTNPVIIYPNVNWRYGGGGTHTFDFSGSGDWIVNNYFRNNNNAGTLVLKSGTGTMTWTGTNVGAAVSSILIGSPVTVSNGLMVLKSSDLILGQNIFLNSDGVNTGILKYDAASGVGAFSGTITGAGTLIMTNGTLSLSGNSTFSGSIFLGGGELIANRAETVGVSGPLGQGGTITFNGGTLGFSAANNYDYSPRFSTAANQKYIFDSGGQSVTFATGLSSSGGTVTKVGSGTVTLAGANTYSGLTTVSAGKLVFLGTKSGAANITVADGAVLGVVENGSQITPATLTVGITSSATLEFNNVNSTTTAPFAAGTVSAGGTITINVNSGTFNTIGAVYPLLSWTGGAAPAVTLGLLNGASGNLSTNGNTIQLTITGTPFTWTGLTDGNWDLTTLNNWKQSGSSAIFGNGLPTVFDDTSTGVTSITVAALVQPGSVTINNETNAYNIVSSGANNIGGSGNLTKVDTGVAVLSGGANTYSGVTTVSGGILSVGALANGGAASDIGTSSSAASSLVLNGGTLQYTGGGASIDRLFTVGTGNGALDASGTGALVLGNTGLVGLSGTGARTLTLTGTDVDDNTLAASLRDNGGATSLAKNGTGKWVLTGTNTYTGLTTVANGTLQVGAASASGTLGTGNVVNNGSLRFNSTGTVTNNGVVSGTGSVTTDGTGTIILAANNSYSGGTTINAGTLQIGNGGASGSLNSGSGIVNNGLLVFNTTGSSSYQGGGAISGTGNVIVTGGGKIKVIGANSYTGWTRIDSGSTFQPIEGNAGGLTTSVVTNNGALKFVRQDAVFTYGNNIVGSGKVFMGANNNQAGGITLSGSNTYSGGTFIGGGAIVFGDNANPGFGSFVGNVTFTNNFDTPDDNTRTLTFNRPDDFTFSGNIVTNFTSAQNNRGIVRHDGSGVLTLTGNNTYGSGTVISVGTLQVGNGGTSGSIGTGSVTDNGTLVFNRSDDVTLSNSITGTGAFVKHGSGTLTLVNTNLSNTGITTVSNGTLIVSGQFAPSTVGVGGSDLYMEGGTLIPGGVGTIVTNVVANSLYIDSGTIVFTLNKSLAASNTVIWVTNIASSYSGNITITGGKLKLINAGPALQVGDKFTLFALDGNNPSQMTGANNLTFVTPGFTINASNLAIDGSVTVTAVSPAPTISTTVSGGNLNLSWPADWTGGVHLQSQTNTLTKGLSTNWFTIPGTDVGNAYSAAINKTNGAVFYRLIAP